MLNWNDVIKFANHGNPEPPFKMVKSDQEWKLQLTAQQFQITRKHGTEAPHTGEFCEAHLPGLYACICCGTELFDSRVKFESGTGWPSFTQPVEVNAIKYIKDVSFGMVRVEIQCNVCEAHLGHVFPDGPPPSGLRYCTNSASLKHVEEV
jgi:methionine-R-sulfoxide reductase